MKKAISIPELLSGEKPTESKGIEFTHYLSESGEKETSFTPSEFKEVIYLGKCCVKGHLFAAYKEDGDLSIYKGHLNNGTY